MNYIYADFMKCDSEQRLVLSTRGTARDLEKLKLEFVAGMKAIFYNGDEDPDGNRDDLVVEGIVEFDEIGNVWTARIDWDSITNLSKVPDHIRQSWNLDDKRNTLEEALRKYLNSKTEHSLSVRTLAERDRVIPILLEWGGLWALSLSAEVFFYPFDDAFEPRLGRETESSTRIRNTINHLAAKTYSELKHLAPVRGDSDVTCGGCNGSGVVDGPIELRDRVVCYCGGLGWVPSDDIYPHYEDL